MGPRVRPSVRFGSLVVPVLEPARRGGPPEPEVYFRIVHVALDTADGPPVYREQTVEVALGPRGAFENGNIGTLTRQVPSEQVVSAVLPPRGKPRLPMVPRPSRVAELLRKAQVWQAQLTSEEVQTQAEIARREGITRARVTQIMGLLRLVPEIQERILALPPMAGRAEVSERCLRPLSQMQDSREQIAAFFRLLTSEWRM